MRKKHRKNNGFQCNLLIRSHVSSYTAKKYIDWKATIQKADVLDFSNMGIVMDSEGVFKMKNCDVSNFGYKRNTFI